MVNTSKPNETVVQGSEHPYIATFAEKLVLMSRNFSNACLAEFLSVHSFNSVPRMNFSRPGMTQFKCLINSDLELD